MSSLFNAATLQWLSEQHPELPSEGICVGMAYFEDSIGEIGITNAYGGFAQMDNARRLPGAFDRILEKPLTGRFAWNYKNRPIPEGVPDLPATSKDHLWTMAWDFPEATLRILADVPETMRLVANAANAQESPLGFEWKEEYAVIVGHVQGKNGMYYHSGAKDRPEQKPIRGGETIVSKEATPILYLWKLRKVQGVWQPFPYTVTQTSGGYGCNVL